MPASLSLSGYSLFYLADTNHLVSPGLNVKAQKKLDLSSLDTAKKTLKALEFDPNEAKKLERERFSPVLGAAATLAQKVVQAVVIIGLTAITPISTIVYTPFIAYRVAKIFTQTIGKGTSSEALKLAKDELKSQASTVAGYYTSTMKSTCQKDSYHPLAHKWARISLKFAVLPFHITARFVCAVAVTMLASPLGVVYHTGYSIFSIGKAAFHAIQKGHNSKATTRDLKDAVTHLKAGALDTLGAASGALGLLTWINPVALHFAFDPNSAAIQLLPISRVTSHAAHLQFKHQLGIDLSTKKLEKVDWRSQLHDNEVWFHRRQASMNNDVDLLNALRLDFPDLIPVPFVKKASYTPAEIRNHIYELQEIARQICETNFRLPRNLEEVKKRLGHSNQLHILLRSKISMKIKPKKRAEHLNKLRKVYKEYIALTDKLLLEMDYLMREKSAIRSTMQSSASTVSAGYALANLSLLTLI